MGAYCFSARFSNSGRAAVVRCDHCREEIGLGAHRYWRMQFCCSACLTAYQERLSPDAKVKIARCFELANLRKSVAR